MDDDNEPYDPWPREPNPATRPDDLQLHPIRSDDPLNPAASNPPPPESFKERWHEPVAARVTRDEAPSRTRTRERKVAPARGRRGPSWPVILVLLLLAAGLGVAAGLAFPQVRGATNEQLKSARERADEQARLRSEDAREIKVLKEDAQEMEQENATLRASVQKATTEQAAQQKAQTALTQSQSQLATTASAVSASLASLRDASRTAGGVAPVIDLNAQAGTSVAVIFEQLTRAHELAPAQQKAAVGVVDKALKEAQALIDQATTTLNECKDQPCRVKAPGTYASQLAAISDRVTGEMTKLIEAAPATTPDPEAKGQDRPGADNDTPGVPGAPVPSEPSAFGQTPSASADE